MRPVVRAVRLDLAAADCAAPLLGVAAQQRATCVYWRLDAAADVGAVVRALLPGLAHDCLVYVALSDARMAQQLVAQADAAASSATLFLPDGSRRPAPSHSGDAVVAAFEAARFRLIHRESGAELADRLGSNMLPLDRLCASVHVFLAFTRPFCA